MPEGLGELARRTGSAGRFPAPLEPLPAESLQGVSGVVVRLGRARVELKCLGIASERFRVTPKGMQRYPDIEQRVGARAYPERGAEVLDRLLVPLQLLQDDAEVVTGVRIPGIGVYGSAQRPLLERELPACGPVTGEPRP